MGYLLRPATVLERLLLFASSLLLIDPGLVTDTLGFGLLAVTFMLQRTRKMAPAGKQQRKRS